MKKATKLRNKVVGHQETLNRDRTNVNIGSDLPNANLAVQKVVALVFWSLRSLAVCIRR